jgi:hypothetical protein
MSSSASKRASIWERWSRKCSYIGCKTTPMKSVFNGDGITLAGLAGEQEWYCGPECLEFALRIRFAEVIRHLKPVEAPRPARVPLGLMLFQRGSMNEEQFKAALEEHRHSGARIGDVALQLGFVSEEQVAAALAAQWGYPVCPMKGQAPRAPQQIPTLLMQMHQMLPIQVLDDSRKLLLGFATRVEHSVIQGIEKVLGCVVAPCFITHTDYRNGLNLLIARGSEQVIYDRVCTTLEMSEIVAQAILRANATGLRYALCREYLWTRITSPEKSIDLMFRLEVA